MSELPTSKAEAKALGVNRYCTGKPCKRGHVAERNLTGQCIPCYKAQQRGEIPKRTHSPRAEAIKLGRSTYVTDEPCCRGHLTERRVIGGCIECTKINVKASYLKNMDKSHARSYEWYLANKEKYQDWAATRYQSDPETHREKSREWGKANRKTRLASTQRRRAKKLAADGSHTKEDIEALFIEQKALCAYCYIDISSGYHVDHYYPISKGGSDWPENLRLACQPCNQRKNAKLPDVWELELAVSRTAD